MIMLFYYVSIVDIIVLVVEAVADTVDDVGITHFIVPDCHLYLTKTPATDCLQMSKGYFTYCRFHGNSQIRRGPCFNPGPPCITPGPWCWFCQKGPRGV
jgi:hypothetical protein